MKEGVIYKTTGSWYTIQYQDHFLHARLKGKYKIDQGISSTNPLAVGDRVLFEESDGSDETDYMITEILPRDNYIVRASPHNFRQKHIIAANLDQVVVMATLKNPRTSMGFIDRFLVSAEMYHIPAVILFNKKDLYKTKELERYEEAKSVYEKIGYQVHLLSSIEPISDDIKSIFANKFTLISGHSGVGKSTFLNRLIPNLSIKTTEVSEATGKGLHTTTFAEAHDIPFGGTIVDTPGIRELGITDLQEAELAGYYPEMRNLVGQCAFNNCLHIEEPKCAVKNELGKSVSLLRYQNYRAILDSIENEVY